MTRLKSTLLSLSLLLLAAAGTQLSSVLDQHFRRQYQLGFRLSLARQIATQVEVLFLSARQKNEPHPLQWATQVLSMHATASDLPPTITTSNNPAGSSQLAAGDAASATRGDQVKQAGLGWWLGWLEWGDLPQAPPPPTFLPQPPLFQLSFFEGESARDFAGEHFELRRAPPPDVEVLHYEKIIDRQSGSGILMELPLGYLGFLGSHSTLHHDGARLACFLLLAASLQLLRRGRSRPLAETAHPKSEQELEQPQQSSEREPTLLVSDIQAARQLLIQIGLNFQAMIKPARDLATASAQSKINLEQIVVSLAGSLGQEQGGVLERFKPAAEPAPLADEDPAQATSLLTPPLRTPLPTPEELLAQVHDCFQDIAGFTTQLNQAIHHTTHSFVQEARLLEQLEADFRKASESSSREA